MYLIKKQVGRNFYYWNDRFESWEGLKNNATAVDEINMRRLMDGFLKQYNSQDYSFSKIVERPGVVITME